MLFLAARMQCSTTKTMTILQADLHFELAVFTLLFSSHYAKLSCRSSQSSVDIAGIPYLMFLSPIVDMRYFL